MLAESELQRLLAKADHFSKEKSVFQRTPMPLLTPQRDMRLTVAVPSFLTSRSCTCGSRGPKDLPLRVSEGWPLGALLSRVKSGLEPWLVWLRG